MAKKDKAEKPKKNKTMPKVEQVFNLFVVASIAWLSFIVLSGLEDPLRYFLAAPAIAWAVLTLIRQALK